MKVHQYARGIWDEPALSLGCKRLRPLAPKLRAHHEPRPTSDSSSITTTLHYFDLKTTIQPDSSPTSKPASYLHNKHSSSTTQVIETHSGGTRWNPTQEQIGILEMLYRRGMRTPNTQQIEHITSQLSKYGKIEGKNVFYWFQNHKARERQKQKRNSLGLAHTTRTPSPPIITAFPFFDPLEEKDSPYKRKCMKWEFECSVEGDKTLELFPLHPEGMKKPNSYFQKT